MPGHDARQTTGVGQLARLGFTDATRAQKFFAAPALEPIRVRPAVLEVFALAADPDLALSSLGRIADAATESRCCEQLLKAFVDDQDFRERLIFVLGASEALAEHLIRHPQDWVVLAAPEFNAARPAARTLHWEMIAAVSQGCRVSDWERGATALRSAYRRRLLGLAARDLSGLATYGEVTAELSDLADAVLAACLELARCELPIGSAPCRIAIIALGKCGARELNYISDVDVVFVAEAGLGPDGSLADETEALVTATFLARGVMRAANEATSEGSIWEVDAGLRPEGKSGALVRTLASHVGYYQRWAQTWEFQALLKARPAAGDAELGAAYVDAVIPFVWAAAARPDFVADVQAMRRRVEENIPSRDADRELKLGRGGLRDVEFSVQMLQLVHGRSDVMLRSANTMTALESMAIWGYVGREDAATLASAYRFLRTLEHRLQLYRMQRTHLVPADEDSLRRLGRSMGFRRNPADQLTDQWHRHRRAVRRLHEKLFYRPLLNAVARLAPGEARLTLEAARERLTALGYADPDGALRHLEALTAGVSRRAAIQRTLLPVLLGWFADAPDPDAGLLAFRRVSEELGGTPWYLRLLRDQAEAAERMAHILATSRYATDLLLRVPDSVSLLSDAGDLSPRARDDLASEMTTTVRRAATPEAAMESVRAIRRRELFRVAAGDICGLLNVETVGAALSEISDLLIEAALSIAASSVATSAASSVAGPMVGRTKSGVRPTLPTRFAIIGFGRLGGREASYASDADVMFVHDPLPGADGELATKAAFAIANEVRRLLALPSSDPPLKLDPDLRPEGRSGALVRTLASYAAYYARWSSPWEAQALLRARALAGDPELAAEFIAMIDPFRWPVAGITDSDLREIRRIKARIESERLPRGADPALHAKLGRGGLVDVEWVAQLMQLRHAGRSESVDRGDLQALRSTNTLEVLRGCVAANYIGEQDAAKLTRAWTAATKVRNAVILVTGHAGDQLPVEAKALAGVAYLLGYPPGESGRLTDDYLRATRQARTVVERLFYGWD